MRKEYKSHVLKMPDFHNYWLFAWHLLLQLIFLWFFRELNADKPKMTCWSLLCGYPRRVTQIKIHSAEGLQKQDRSGGKCKGSLEEWKGLLQSCNDDLSWYVSSQKLPKQTEDIWDFFQHIVESAQKERSGELDDAKQQELCVTYAGPDGQ